MHLKFKVAKKILRRLFSSPSKHANLPPEMSALSRTQIDKYDLEWFDGSKKETPQLSSESSFTSLYIRYNQLDRFIP